MIVSISFWIEYLVTLHTKISLFDSSCINNCNSISRLQSLFLKDKVETRFTLASIPPKCIKSIFNLALNFHFDLAKIQLFRAVSIIFKLNCLSLQSFHLVGNLLGRRVIPREKCRRKREEEGTKFIVRQTTRTSRRRKYPGAEEFVTTTASYPPLFFVSLCVARLGFARF